ncbi:hypothetical protein BpHYR1_024025 [Brachionus plicatilis]|uniref:Uncharacterized protein n=1 Tax=Brachionus plicatilis TaxID=10195 RepID=A0A3M7SII8_BRAPC|nr:hypothetical protein BpHYR1_024025 [Brachionus plicatilis]
MAELCKEFVHIRVGNRLCIKPCINCKTFFTCKLYSSIDKQKAIKKDILSIIIQLKLVNVSISDFMKLFKWSSFDALKSVLTIHFGCVDVWLCNGWFDIKCKKQLSGFKSFIKNKINRIHIFECLMIQEKKEKIVM